MGKFSIVRIIFGNFTVLSHVPFAPSKTENALYEIYLESCRTIKTYKIFGKSQNCLGTPSNVQSPVQELICGTSVSKYYTKAAVIKVFCYCPALLDF